jgi:hypothetical protein
VTEHAPAVRRMLVVSLPMVTWADIPLDRMTNLRALLEQSLVADLSVRGVHLHPTLGDAYVTISAGTRAVGNVRDGDAIERRDGAIVARVFPEVVDHNADLLFDAHPGALATTLRRAGINRAVIGNADRELRVAASGSVSSARERQVADALATPDGFTSGGAVGERLLEADTGGPFGIRLNPAAYLTAFRRAWTGRTVVLVEDSDLVRFDASHRSSANDDADRAAALDELLTRFDRLLGEMLASVDPERDAVMVIGPVDPSGVPQLTVAALRVPGTRAGLGVSGFTRRSGFVSIVDVAPTILDSFRVDAPESMEGRPLKFGRTGGSFADRRSLLIDANRAARFRDARTSPVTSVFLVAQLVLTLAAAVALSLPWRGFRRAVELGALSVLGTLPAMFLAGLLPFDRYGVSLYWLFLAGLGTAIGVGAYLVSDRRGIGPLVIALSVIVGVLVVDVTTGARLQFNTVWGYSPTVGGRFAGIGNLAYAQLSAAALLLAALVAYRVGGRAGAGLGSASLGLAVLVDGMPIWGSDVGGVLSMVPAYAIAVTGLLGLRVRLRSLLLVVGVTAFAVVAFTLVDVSRPRDHQTHLGRLVESTREDGWHSFAIVVERKLSSNLNALFWSQWTVIVPIALAGIAFVVYRAPGRLGAVYERIATMRPALVALAVLAVLGFGLNDSGIPIPGVMLGVLTPVLIVLLLRGQRGEVVA